MTKKTSKKPIGRTVLFGAISAVSYIVLFTNESVVNDLFIRGGLYAALPIITALYFSLVHGAFASGLLSVFGLKARSDH